MVKYFRLNILRNTKIFRLRRLTSKKEDKVTKDNEGKHSKSKKIGEERLLEPIKDHYFTFQHLSDLFTLLYSSLVFKWINTDRLLLLVKTPKEGYLLEIFLRSFLLNSVYLDREMPVNTNLHFYSQFLKGKYNIIITNTEYSSNSPKYPQELIDSCPIPITIIYFNCTSTELLDLHSFHQNTRSIYHFISGDNKEQFIKDYTELNKQIKFSEYHFDMEQMCHLRYRCEDIYHGIGKNDIKKEKTRKINIELLHSKKMEEFFKQNPKEKENVISAIEENNIKSIRPSSSYLPSYLIHQDNNAIADAIRNTYPTGRRNRRRNKKGKMEEYLDALDKGDGSHQAVNL